MLAVFSVFVAPRLQSRFSALQILSVCLTIQALLLIAMTQLSVEGIAVCVVLSGSVNGICNTVYTEIALEVSDSPRPVASAGYNFVRWFAGVVAPFVVPMLAEHFGSALAFYVAAAAALIAPLVLFARRSSLGHYGGEQSDVQQSAGVELKDELIVFCTQ